jgi:NTE family protein
VDGGLTSPVPVKLARAMGADVVIAVDVSWFAQARNGAGDSMARYGRSGRYQLLTDELAVADLVIVPLVERTRMLDFENKVVNIAAGEEAGRSAVLQLRETVARIAAAKQARGTASAAQGDRQD